MRKKPDILLLLSVLVVSGVIISNFVFIGHSDRSAKNLSSLNAQYSQIETDIAMIHTMDHIMEQSIEQGIADPLKSQVLARIDSSKQQIR